MSSSGRSRSGGGGDAGGVGADVAVPVLPLPLRADTRASAGRAPGALVARFVLLSWRMLLAHRVRTALALSAMVFGQAIMILTFGMARGMQDSLVDQVCRLATGHIQVQAPGYLESERMRAYLARPIPLATLRRASPRVREHRCRVRIAGYLEAEGATPGERGETQLVAGWGVDPALETPPLIVAGEPLPHEPAGLAPYPIVIGAEAARTLAARPGSLLILNFVTPDGRLDSVQCRVAGVADEGSPERNRIAMLIHRRTAQKVLAIGEGVHQQLLVLDDAAAVPEAAAALAHALGSEVRVLPWHETHPQLRRVTRVIHSQMLVLTFVVVVVTLFGIGSTIAITGAERVRHYGLLGVLGMGRSWIFLYVVSEALVVGVVTVLAAGLMALAGIGLLGLTSVDLTPMAGEPIVLDGVRIDMTLRPVVRVAYFVRAALLVLATAFAASLLPAWRASRLHPAESLRVHD
jgi:ABC-type lipoprotein release transport system permease subunit